MWFPHMPSDSSVLHEAVNNLSRASSLVFDAQFALAICRTHRTVLVELLTRALQQIEPRLVAAAEGNKDDLLLSIRVFRVLGVILPLYPHCATTVASFCSRVTPPFEAALSSVHVTQTSDLSPDSSLVNSALHASERHQDDCNAVADVDVFLALHAFLLHLKDVVLGQWNLTFTFAQLANQATAVSAVARACVSLLLSAHGQAKEVILGHDSSLTAHLLEREREIVRVEQRLMFCEPPSAQNQTTASTSVLTFMVYLGETLVPKHPVSQQAVPQTNRPQNTLAKIPTTTDCLSRVGQVLLSSPHHGAVLLIGPSGCGKTSILREISHLVTGSVDESAGLGTVWIFLDDNVDVKALVGVYVCTDVPGKFEWQPGPLFRAVVNGLWVVIEDIDLATPEVMFSLTTLIEHNELYVPGNPVPVRAAPGFRLFATATTTLQSRKLPPALLDLWVHVECHAIPRSDLCGVISTTFPAVAPLASLLVKSFIAAADHIAEVSKAHDRQLTARDLLKLCRRLQRIIDQQHSPVVADTISHTMRAVVLGEMHMCFFACLPPNLHVGCLSVCARLWGIDPEIAATSVLFHKPVMRVQGVDVECGRARLSVYSGTDAAAIAKFKRSNKNASFAQTAHVLRLMEQVSMAVAMREPVLLVGETGAGKTSAIQGLAEACGTKLLVQNMSHQSDSADLIGGFRPADLRASAAPLKSSFDTLFAKTFSKKANEKFLQQVSLRYQRGEWGPFVQHLHSAIKLVHKKFDASAGETDAAKQQALAESKKRWEAFENDMRGFERQAELTQSDFCFQFVEGQLVQAMREGYWVLLDEINLAPPDILQRLAGVLEGGSLSMTERGGSFPHVTPHPNFRLLAAMNPPTDVGKRGLAPSLRSRFTEIYVGDFLDESDLTVLVSFFLDSSVGPSPPIRDIVSLYITAKAMSAKQLKDGDKQPVQWSLRTLCRALRFAVRATPHMGLLRGLWEGVCMSFATQLCAEHRLVFEDLVKKHLPLKGVRLEGPPPSPPNDTYLVVEDSWIRTGPHKETAPPPSTAFVVTPWVKGHLKALSRAISCGTHPILLQGPTSAGKTSMVQYIASLAGHSLVRINNHEHTDLQEYLGFHAPSEDGSLVWRDGALARALRLGEWVVLDELNLAPSEVLEALNRLLDDNRELFVPDTQETIRPHPNFVLFATQNPPGVYGGRKVLSRALRNRFVEVHIGDIPPSDLKTILAQRCSLPESRTGCMVSVMEGLQRHRLKSNVFGGKSGAVTSRDLVRWAERGSSDYQQLAEAGFVVLAEKLRHIDERELVRATIEKHFPRVKLAPDNLYDSPCSLLDHAATLTNSTETAHDSQTTRGVGTITWTKEMKRLLKLVDGCLAHTESVLLVGDTGCGKTTISQIVSELRGQRLHILNCHQHTETSDFVGGMRPVRHRAEALTKFRESVNSLLALSGPVTVLVMADEKTKKNKRARDTETVVDVETAHALAPKHLIKAVGIAASAVRKSGNEDTTAQAETLEKEARQHYSTWRRLYEWVDGPLTQAMRNGDILLVDEISLADHAVLERLNSVLDPSRTLVLPEKPSECGGADTVVAHPQFRIIATMNPGGDFGKKELTPALRSRFTEVWCYGPTSRADLEAICNSHFGNTGALCELSPSILDTVEWLRKTTYFHHTAISLRDIITWVEFIRTTSAVEGSSTALSFLHGCCLVFLDGIGLGGGSNLLLAKARNECLAFAVSTLTPGLRESVSHVMSTQDPYNTLHQPAGVMGCVEDRFFVSPFSIRVGNAVPNERGFALDAPSTAKNVFRVVRALQMPKAILLEGSPGVGKTALIEALGKASGHKVVRINMSDQTDLMDLLGTDLPVDTSKSTHSSGPTFAWADGVFLEALKQGSWVLLDELNLAPQSVLEGLNACLDHRASMYVPELDQTFNCPPTFRVFAAQNPIQQGGGRKGLPQSFLNRFTKVVVDALSGEDLSFILSCIYPSLSKKLTSLMVEFNQIVVEMIGKRCIAPQKADQQKQDDQQTTKDGSSVFGMRGGPWEFNLRDMFRWCSLICHALGLKPDVAPETPVDFTKECQVAAACFRTIYIHRMRTEFDRFCLIGAFTRVFDMPPLTEPNPHLQINSHSVQSGFTFLPTTSRRPLEHRGGTTERVLPSQLPVLEAVAACVHMNWAVLLTGPSGSGKSSVIRALADMVGVRVTHFGCTPATDTSDLLGSFEQTDTSRTVATTVAYVHELATDICSEIVQFVLKHGHSDQLALPTTIWSALGALQQLHNNSNNKFVVPTFASAFTNVFNAMDAALSVLHHASEQHAALAQTFEKRMQAGREHVLRTLRKAQRGGKGEFEWVDGVLSQAVERGDWLVLEAANLCNASVLDRLNPLLERDGSLALTECGLCGGEVRVLRPTNTFRVFLCMDPAQGEVSRAMRNRAVEIFCDSPVPSLRCTTELVVCRGLRCESAVIAMQKTHLWLSELSRTAHFPPPSLRHLARWAKFTVARVENGESWQKAVEQSLVLVFARWLAVHANHAAKTASSDATGAESQPAENTKPKSVLSRNPASAVKVEKINDEEARKQFLAKFQELLAVATEDLSTNSDQALSVDRLESIASDVIHLVNHSVVWVRFAMDRDVFGVDETVSALKWVTNQNSQRITDGVVNRIAQQEGTETARQWLILHQHLSSSFSQKSLRLLAFNTPLGESQPVPPPSHSLQLKVAQSTALRMNPNSLSQLWGLVSNTPAKHMAGTLWETVLNASETLGEEHANIVANMFAQTALQAENLVHALQLPQAPQVGADVRFNQPVALLCDVRLPEDSSSIYNILLSRGQTLTRLIVAVTLAAYRNQDSVLAMSRLKYEGQSQAQLVSAVVTLLFPFVHSLVQFLVSATCDAIEQKQLATTKQLSDLAEEGIRWAWCCSQNTLEGVPFAYHWMFLLNKLSALPPNLVPPNLVTLAERISAALPINVMKFPQTLWNVGGHPPAPCRGHPVLGVLHSLRVLCSVLSLDCSRLEALSTAAPEHPLLFATEELRSDVCDVICSAVSVAAQPAGEAQQEFTSVLEEAVDSVWKKLEDLHSKYNEMHTTLTLAQKKQDADLGLDDIDEDVELLTRTLEVSRGWRELQAEMWRLRTCHGIVTEHDALSALCWLGVWVVSENAQQQKTWGAEANQTLSKLREVTESMASTCLVSCDSLEHAAAYRQIALAQLATNSEGVMSGILTVATQWLLGVSGRPFSMIFPWLAELKSATTPSKVSSHDAASIHYSGLFVHFVDLLRWEHVPLVSKQAKLSQLTDAWDLIKNPTHTNAHISDWALVTAQWLTLLCVHVPQSKQTTAKSQKITALTRMIRCLCQLAHTLCASNMLNIATQQTMRIGLNLAEKVASSCDETDFDPHFCTVMNQILPEILLQFESYTQSLTEDKHRPKKQKRQKRASSTKQQQQQSQSEWMIEAEEGTHVRGLLWIWLGVARVQILQPPHPFDPAMPHALEEGWVQAQCNDVRSDIGAHTLVSGGLHHPCDTARAPLSCLTESLASLMETHDTLQSKVVARPANHASLLKEFHSHVQTLVTTLVPPTRIHNLLQSITTSNNDTTVSVWQSTMQRWVETTTEKFCGRVVVSPEKTSWDSERNQKAEGNFNDIAMPVIVGAESVRYGIALVEASNKATQPSCMVGETIGLLTRFPTTTTVDRESEAPCTPTKRPAPTDASSIRIRSIVERILEPRAFAALKSTTEGKYFTCNVLLSCINLLVDEVRGQGKVSATHLRMCHLITKAFVEAWREDDEKRKQAEMERESTFRYKDHGKTFEEANEPEENELMREMFPDYYTEFEGIDPTTTEPQGDAANKTATPQKNTPAKAYKADAHTFHGAVTDEMCEALADMHAALFAELQGTTSQTGSRLVKVCDRLRLAAQMQAKLAVPLPTTVDREALVGHALLHGVAVTALSPPTTIKMETDTAAPQHWVCEVAQASHPLLELQSAALDVLAQYPENAVLEGLIRTCDVVLKTPLSAPLVRALTGVEIVLTKAHSWESVCPKHLSLSTFVGPVASLVRVWRKTELAAWERLLDSRLQKRRKQTCKFWLQLASLLLDWNVTEDEEAMAVRQKVLFETVDRYLTSSPSGEFEMRLSFLRNFSAQLNADRNSRTEFPRIVFHNLCHYYTQHLEDVREAMTKRRNMVESRLVDLVKISKWDEASYFSLRESSQKSHRQLSKLVLEFENEVLDVPVLTLLSQKQQQPAVEKLTETTTQQLDTPMTTQKNFGSVEPHNLELDLNSVFALGDKSLRVGQQERIRKKIRELSQPWEPVPETDDAPPQGMGAELAFNVREFISSVVERSTELRNEPKKQPKQLALTQLLQALRGDLGLSPFLKGTITPLKELLSSHTAGMELAALLQNRATATDSPLIGQWNTCNRKFYRCLAKMWKARDCSKQPHADLQSGVSARLIASCEHLLQMVVDQRSFLEQGILSQHKLQQLVEATKSLVEDAPLDECTQVIALQSDLVALHADFLVVVNALSTSLQELLLLQETKQSNLVSTAGIPKLSTHVEQAKADLLSCVHSTPTQTYIGPGGVKLLQQIAESLVTATNEFGNTKNLSWTPIAEALEPLLAQVPTLQSRLSSILSARSSSVRAQNINEKCQSLTHECDQVVTGVMLSIQTLRTTSTLLADSTSEQEPAQPNDGPSSSTDPAPTNDVAQKTNANLSNVTKAVQDVCSGSQIDELCNRLLSVNRLVSEMCQQQRSAVECGAVWVVRDVCLTLQQGLASVGCAIQGVVDLHTSLCNLLYVLLSLFVTLATEGFCTPPPEGDGTSQGGEGTLENMDGTGAGEGEGTKDVSNQLDNEQQIEGLRGENDANADEPPPDDEGGVEMTNDFEGTVTDMPKDDQQNDNDDDEDDDKEELTREMGDNRDDDEQVVDEKLWDDNEDNDNVDDQENTYEKDAPMETSGETTLEHRQGDDSASDSDDDDKDKNKDKPKDKPKDTKQQDMPDDGDMDDAADEMAMPELEDNHGIDPQTTEPDDLDLPDDLQLDGGKDQDDADPDNDGGSDTSSDLSVLDDENNKFNEDDNNVDENDGNPDDGAHTDTESIANDQDDEMPVDSTPSAPQTHDETQPAPEAGQGVGQDHNVDEKETQDQGPDDEDDAAQQQQQADDENQNQIGAEPDVKQGQEGDSANHPNEDTGMDSMQTMQQQAQQPEQATQQEKSQARMRPNPYRSLGDATREWKKRINASEEKDKPKTDETTKQEETDTSQHKDFEFVRQENEDTATDQAMADATEDQAKEMQLTENAKDDDKTGMSDTESQTDARDDPPQADTQMLDTATDEENDDTSANKNDKRQKGSNMKGRGKDAKMKETESDDESTKDAGDAGDEDQAQDPDEQLATSSDRWMGSLQRADELRNQAKQENATNAPDNDDGDDNAQDGDATMQTDEIIDESQGEWDWGDIKSNTADLAADLCEQLRLLLEPMVCAKMQGDYRTGKRINMKKVIPYIASGFKRDKIWLRRTKPNKRDYSILVCIDDSASMRNNKAHVGALQAMAVICQAMERLEVGSVGLISFARDSKVVLPLGTPFTDDAAARAVQQFSFKAEGTRLTSVVNTATNLLNQHTSSAGGHGRANVDQYQIIFVICDGGHSETAQELIPVAHKALAEQKLFCFLVLDDETSKDSVLNRKFVDYSNGLKIIPYLDWFPFPFYMLLSDISALPDCLADALRQWFDFVQRQ